MTKQLIALALAAAFGIAHAADTAGGSASQNTATPSKGVGSDSAVGNVPQTTQPIGTNAPDKADQKKAAKKKTQQKSQKASSNQKDPNKKDPDTAVGEVPQTTLGVGTNAPAKGGSK